jgi:release factor glutamine methyltransferase
MTIHDLVQGARDRLIEAGIGANNAARDAELLARQVLGWDKARFLTDREEAATTRFLLGYEHFVARRMRREPMSYILGTREFWSLDFEVTPDVLIPRPETELIVEEALEIRDLAEKGVRHLFPGRREKGAVLLFPTRPLIYDIGTGSGVLAIVLAREFPEARIIATDISPHALRIARRNAARHGVADRITFVETSFLDGLEDRAELIVSNPPYVPALSKPALSPEVRDYEPDVAVYGGDDGMDGLRRVVEDAAARLAPGGWLIVEFGYGQEEAVVTLVNASPVLSLIKVRGDLQDIPRTLVAQRRA